MWVHFSSSNLWFLWASGWMVIMLRSTRNNNIKRIQKSRQTCCFWFFIYQIPTGISKRDEGTWFKKKKVWKTTELIPQFLLFLVKKKLPIGKGSRVSMTKSWMKYCLSTALLGHWHIWTSWVSGLNFVNMLYSPTIWSSCYHDNHLQQQDPCGSLLQRSSQVEQRPQLLQRMLRGMSAPVSGRACQERRMNKMLKHPDLFIIPPPA